MSNASDEARRRWKDVQKNPGVKTKGDDKRSQWDTAKSMNEAVHIHFECTCNACAQEFTICGLPCFVICPNCQLILRMRFA